MANQWQVLCTCVLFMLVTQIHSQEVPIKLVDGAAEKKAVCIDGTAAGYHFAAGSGDGANNWMIELGGGGWCWEGQCAQRIGQWNGSTKNVTTYYFEGILSSNKTVNPDFYNWNRILVRYCDGASYIGDNEANEGGIQVQLRGSRIFSAVIDELLEKGMKNADNALLAGASAGGLAAMLHCDDFRALLPNVGRVKCLSDSGFFIRAKDLPFKYTRDMIYTSTVSFHNLTNFLPKDCTSRMNASLCLWPEYFVGSIKTPLFMLNSAFDSFQIHDNMAKYPDPLSWNRCTSNLSKCSPDQLQRIKDFGKTFYATVNEIGDNPSRGLLINACFLHVMANSDVQWNNIGYGVENRTVAQAFGDWYFDRSSVKLIDAKWDLPSGCRPL